MRVDAIEAEIRYWQQLAERSTKGVEKAKAQIDLLTHKLKLATATK